MDDVENISICVLLTADEFQIVTVLHLGDANGSLREREWDNTEMFGKTN